MQTTERPWYSVTGAAAKAALHPDTIRHYIRSGRLRATKFGNTWRISPEDLDALLREGVA